MGGGEEITLRQSVKCCLGLLETHTIVTLTACEISANVRGDCVTPCVCNIRFSANMRDCVMLIAYGIKISAI